MTVILQSCCVEDEIVEVVSCVVARIIYEAVKEIQPRNSFPVNIILEEAHRYISNRSLGAEIEQLELNHVDVSKATIYVPSTTQTNARTLEFHPMQMKQLLEYLYEVRNILLRERNKQTNYLFFSLGKGTKLDNVLQNSMNELKKKNRYFKSLSQLRESRISLWLKEHGVRKAQYLSGMKNASSMMRYVTHDIEKLRQKLAIIHPMERLSNIGK